MKKLIDYVKSYLTYPDPEVSWALLIGLISAMIVLVCLLTGCGHIQSGYAGKWLSINGGGIREYSLFDGGFGFANGSAITWQESAHNCTIYIDNKASRGYISNDTLILQPAKYVRQ